MKRLMMILSAILLIGMAGTVPANAQFGKILKKAKSALESVGGTTTDGKQLVAKVAETPIASGGTMQNPLKDVVDIDLVGAYGVSTSQNYGYVYLVFKVKMIANKSSMGLGGAINGSEMMAVDQDGNAYKTYTGSNSTQQVTEGVAVKITLNDKDWQFMDVKRTAKTLQLMRFGVYVDAQHRGMVTCKNVPIIWDQEPK